MVELQHMNRKNMSIIKKLNKLLHLNNSFEEKLYIVLSEKDCSKGCYQKESLNENMWVINQLFGDWWKPRYLIDENNKLAYEIMDEQMAFVYFNKDDIDWDSIKTLPEKALSRAESLSAEFPSFIRWFENGVAEVSWQLNPDGHYFMDDDGYGMTSDKEIEIYGFINIRMNVLVKFQHIDQNRDRLKQMRVEAERLNGIHSMQ